VLNHPSPLEAPAGEEMKTQTKKSYREANYLLGDVIKVTPTSKVVGDLAQFMVTNKLSSQDVMQLADTLDFPASVLDFLEGLIGQPYGGFPEPFRSKVLARNKRRKLEKRPGLYLEPLDIDAVRKELVEEYSNVGLSGKEIDECDVAAYIMYPQVYKDFRAVKENYGDLSVLPTRCFLAPPPLGDELSVIIEKGKTLIIKPQAVGELDTVTGKREVYFELNGELRKVSVADKNANVESKASRPKADPGSKSHVGAPISGVVVEVKAKVGDEVKSGDCIAVLSAMKMEMVISAQMDGKISDIFVKNGENVEGSDLIAVIEA